MRRVKLSYYGMLVAVVAIVGLTQAQPAEKRAGDRERLIGAWHLAHIEAPGPDGKKNAGG